jgi:hypothetical protein
MERAGYRPEKSMEVLPKPKVVPIDQRRPKRRYNYPLDTQEPEEARFFLEIKLDRKIVVRVGLT